MFISNIVEVGYSAIKIVLFISFHTTSGCLITLKTPTNNAKQPIITKIGFIIVSWRASYTLERVTAPRHAPINPIGYSFNLILKILLLLSLIYYFLSYFSPVYVQFYIL